MLKILIFLYILLITLAFVLLGCDCIPAHAEVIDDLIPCIIEIESGGRFDAVSEDGCIGLMQISPIVLREYNEDTMKHYITCYEDGFLDQPIAFRKIDLYNPKVNKQVGTWYLRRLKDHYLKNNYTIERLIASYNCGPTYLKKVNYDISKCPKETQTYVKKVMKLYKRPKGG